MQQRNNANRPHRSYVLMTAAWNEEKYIERPLQAIAEQTLPPKQWMVVSDGSTDRTDEIVLRYAQRYPFIKLYRMPASHQRSFAAQVDAINAGYEQQKHLDFDFVGNLDADLSFEPDYFERLIAEFHADSTLGMAGGTIWDLDPKDGTFAPRRLNRQHSVMHGVQLFRRECFDDLGGYKRLPYGSPDWHAEVFLRMRGWHVRSLPHLKAFHYRPTGSAGKGVLWYSYRQGLADRSLGTHPLFELAKVARRAPSKYLGLNALAELAGFVQAYLRGEKPVASEEFVKYLRREQMDRLLLRRQPGE